MKHVWLFLFSLLILGVSSWLLHNAQTQGIKNAYEVRENSSMQPGLNEINGQVAEKNGSQLGLMSEPGLMFTNLGVVEGTAVIKIAESKKDLEIFALLPSMKNGSYVVWHKDGDQFTRLGKLRFEKGGYMQEISLKSPLVEHAQITISSEQTPEKSPKNTLFILEVQ